jgi:hypothetical protein
MHVCQIILVEAETPEEAFSNVESHFSDGEPRWSDWHNASNSDSLNFAGRWSGAVFGDVNENGEFKTPDTNPNHLRYSDDQARAEEVITRYLEERMASIREYKSKAIDLITYSYDPYASGFNMDLWATKKLAQLLDDEWTCDTGIYDLENWTGNLRYFTERVATRPDNQFLIPVDFHF